LRPFRIVGQALRLPTAFMMASDALALQLI
jgi:hypothetical protein